MSLPASGSSASSANVQPRCSRSLQLLARRNRESDRRLVETRSQEALTRLARHVLELGARDGVASADGIELDVS